MQIYTKFTSLIMRQKIKNILFLNFLGVLSKQIIDFVNFSYTRIHPKTKQMRYHKCKIQNKPSNNRFNRTCQGQKKSPARNLTGEYVLLTNMLAATHNAIIRIVDRTSNLSRKFCLGLLHLLLEHICINGKLDGIRC